MLGGVKGAIGLIFKIVNFEDRVLKLSAFVLGLNLRLVDRQVWHAIGLIINSVNNF